MLRTVLRRSRVNGARASNKGESPSEDSTLVKSVNELTDEQVLLRLQPHAKDVVYQRPAAASYALPKRALAGLRRILLAANQTPGQLQRLADQKTTQLANRPLHEAKVRAVQSANPARRVKWQPMSFKNLEEAAAYALSSSAAHHAEARFVLDELDRFAYRPRSILDYGSGVGSVFWAAEAKWSPHLHEYSFVDPDDYARQFCMEMLRDPTSGLLVPTYANFRRSMTGSLAQKYDIVIAQRTLAELESTNAYLDLVESLWKRTNHYLILIESHQTEYFAALMNARDWIVTHGQTFDYRSAAEAIEDAFNVNRVQLLEVLNDKQASDYEKLCVLKQAGIETKTALESGHIVAPCPHDSQCPLLSDERKRATCRHDVQYAEMRVDGRTQSTRGSGQLRSLFTYTILAKGERPSTHAPGRVLGTSRSSGCVTCRVCTAFDGLQRMIITQRADESTYKKMRAINAGFLMPLKETIVDSESSVQEIRNVFQQSVDAKQS